jgi:hypothetical protein
MSVRTKNASSRSEIEGHITEIAKIAESAKDRQNFCMCSVLNFGNYPILAILAIQGPSLLSGFRKEAMSQQLIASSYS